jgi:hypothetical protein
MIEIHDLLKNLKEEPEALRPSMDLMLADFILRIVIMQICDARKKETETSKTGQLNHRE